MLHLMIFLLLKRWRCLHYRCRDLLADLLLKHLQKGRLLVLIVSALEHHVGVSVMAHLLLTRLENDSCVR